MKKGNKAFTLVELIVVITILAILGTIAFLSLQGYSQNARDGVRVSDIKNIEKGLAVMLVKSGIVPTPDDTKINIMASGTVVGIQGYAGKLMQAQIGMSKDSGKDPLDGTFYTYSTNASKTEYQILGFLESSISQNSLLGKSYAVDYSQRKIITKGSELGILTDSLTRTPIQELANIKSVGILDVTTTTGSYSAIFNSKESISGTGIILKSIIGGGGLLGYWDFDEGSGNIVNDKINNIVGTFSGITLGNYPSWTSGKNGNGLNFNGNGIVLFGELNEKLKLQNLSISFWMKTTNTGSNVVLIETNMNNGYSTQISTSGYPALNVGGYSPYNITKAKNFSKDQWTFYVFQKKSDGNGSIYINGMDSTISGGLAGYPNYGSGVLSFGARNGTSYGYSSVATYGFSGSLDEVRMYNRALSDSEIQTLYNATK